MTNPGRTFHLPAHFKNLGHETPQEDLAALSYLAEHYGTPGGTIVEVGSFAGATSLAIEDGTKRKGCRVLCVDTWKGNPDDCLPKVDPLTLFNTFAFNVGNKLFRTIFPFTGSSVKAAKYFPDESADMVFIDASHNYEDVLNDIRYWQFKVRPGGLLCGHDYSEDFPDVTLAVHEMLSESAIKRYGRCIWAFVKDYTPAQKAVLSTTDTPRFA